MSNLALRAATAAVLVPLVVWGVLWAPTQVFAIGLALFVLAGAWEWADLAGYGVTGRVLFALTVGLGLTLAQGFLRDPVFGFWILGIALVWWLAALLWVVRFQAENPLPWLDHKAVRLPVGVLVLVPAWVAMSALHGSAGRGPEWVMLILLLVWGADTGAYFAGRRFGRRRLASRVSPGKTVEGVAGGLVAAAVISGAYGLWRLETHAAVVSLVLLGVVTALASVLGDLTESLVKRTAGRKDSGVLIPGHGGVLDRIDSLTAAAPVFVAGLAIGGTLH